jgi:hypothetical protein
VPARRSKEYGYDNSFQNFNDPRYKYQNKAEDKTVTTGGQCTCLRREINLEGKINRYMKNTKNNDARKGTIQK